MGDPGRRVFGNRAIANVALQSQFGAARFHGAFFGSAWPWWRGGLVLGWFGPLFWPYAYYDLFDYVYWPYAYDDFWPYAYDDVYYGIYGRYAYSGPYGYRPYGDPTRYYAGRSARRGVSPGRYAARARTTRFEHVDGLGTRGAQFVKRICAEHREFIALLSAAVSEGPDHRR